MVKVTSPSCTAVHWSPAWRWKPLSAPGGTVMDTSSTWRVGSFSNGVVKYRMVWRAGVVAADGACDHAAGASTHVAASAPAMTDVLMSASSNLSYTLPHLR